MDINHIREKIKSKEIFNYNIMLIGFMGTGKTAVSTHLSEMLGMKCIDIDECIIKEQRMPISEIFEIFGENFFRDLESKAIEELKKSSGIIVSCGGGIILRESNVEIIRSQGKIVLLTASPEVIHKRLKGSKDRPILNDNMNVEFVEGLMKKREDKYLEAADIIVDTIDKPIEEVCVEIIKKLLNDGK